MSRVFPSERCLRKTRIWGTVGEALELDLTPRRGLILWWESVGCGGVWRRSLCRFRGSRLGERLGLDLGFRLDLVFAC